MDPSDSTQEPRKREAPNSATRSTTNIACILRALTEGKEGAAEELLPHVYGELHRLAAGFMSGERKGHTLQATALIHEAFVRLTDGSEKSYEDRAQFLSVAAIAMRRVLIDHARKRSALKRGGELARISFDEQVFEVAERAQDLLEIDDAIERLGEQDAFLKELAVLRFYGGLKVAEIAETLGRSERTIERKLRLARAWLKNALE